MNIVNKDIKFVKRQYIIDKLLDQVNNGTNLTTEQKRLLINLMKQIYGYT